MLNVIMLNVVKINVNMPSVVAPVFSVQKRQYVVNLIAVTFVVGSERSERVIIGK
jgi:hypothetical protein